MNNAANAATVAYMDSSGNSQKNKLKQNLYATALNLLKYILIKPTKNLYLKILCKL